MKWTNLQKNKCPKCGAKLIKVVNGYKCINNDYFITDRRMGEIKDNIKQDTGRKDMEGYGF